MDEAGFVVPHGTVSWVSILLGGEGSMSANDGVWRLYRDDELLGEIRVEGSDFPWLYGRFVAQPGFAAGKTDVRARARARGVRR